MLVLQNDDREGVIITKCCHRRWQPMEPFRDEVDCRKKNDAWRFLRILYVVRQMKIGKSGKIGDFQ